MKQLAEIMQAPNHGGSQKQSESQRNGNHSPQDKFELLKAMTIICATQKGYGKTPHELEMLVEGFSMVLAHQPMNQIIGAINKYVAQSNDIPCPADIENIINPPPPKIDWALYIELKKRLRDGRSYVTPDERKFLSQCEEIGVDRMRGEVENYQNAQKQLKSEILSLGYDDEN